MLIDGRHIRYESRSALYAVVAAMLLSVQMPLTVWLLYGWVGLIVRAHVLLSGPLGNSRPQQVGQ